MTRLRGVFNQCQLYFYKYCLTVNYINLKQTINTPSKQNKKK